MLLLRWVFISTLVLINFIVLTYAGVVIYARLTVGSMMGRGPSVSEEVDLIVAILSLWNSCFIGLIMLAATVLYWLIGLHRVPELTHNSNHNRIMKTSLIIIPLTFSIAYMIIRYIWFYYFH